jgi:hypothetical protein
MSLLLRAALLGGIAYLITRSLSGDSTMQRRSLAGGQRTASPRDELHPGENNIWPTSESQQATSAANAGPGS